MAEDEALIPQHGGYRRLKSFQVAQLVYDLTARFCELYVDRYSRTRDQMVQAARSGVQNIAEGSQASATSRKTELKLTNVARASLEELRLDYEDFLRQRGLPLLAPDHPVLVRFKRRRCRELQDVQAWVAEERKKAGSHGRTRTGRDGHGPGLSPAIPGEDNKSVPVRERPCLSLSAALAANAALSLLNLACYLLDRQIAAQAERFKAEGGFSERLYRVRSYRRRGRK
jgi:four helix bundle suffix protein